MLRGRVRTLTLPQHHPVRGNRRAGTAVRGDGEGDAHQHCCRGVEPRLREFEGREGGRRTHWQPDGLRAERELVRRTRRTREAVELLGGGDAADGVQTLEEEEEGGRSSDCAAGDDRQLLHPRVVVARYRAVDQLHDARQERGHVLHSTAEGSHLLRYVLQARIHGIEQDSVLFARANVPRWTTCEVLR